MKKSLFIWALGMLIGSCSTPVKLANQAFKHALLGETEPVIHKRIGAPSRIVAEPDGGKVYIYDFTHVEKLPSMSYNPQAINLTTITSKSGASYDIPYYSKSRNPRNTLYQENITSLFLFIDEHGYCTRIDHDLQKEKLDYFYHLLKEYVPAK